MKWKLAVAGVLLVLGLTTVVLAVDGRAQTAGAPVVAYAYKIEHVRSKKDLKDLEQRLNDAGRTGWRVSKVVAVSINDDMIVVLEKSESPR
jgi:hypothetical protein